jgi:RNA polymerase sigma factor (sigma-70 family)
MNDAEPPLKTGTMREPEDGDLLRRFHFEQSQGAFAELVWRHLDMVYATALRRVGGDGHLAEDVAQTVFSDLVCKAPSLVGRAQLGGWLYQSTRFAAAQVVRTERRRKIREEEAYVMNELHGTPATDWDRMRPVIDDAIDELDESDREMVVLRYFENCPLATVGAKFGLSPDAARMRVNRALEKLHALLAKRGIASTAGALGLALIAQADVPARAGLAMTVVAGAVGSAGVTAGAAGAGKIATMTVTKIIAGCLIGSLGIGLITYRSVSVSPRQNSDASHTAIALIGPETSIAPGSRESTPKVMPSSAPEGKLSTEESKLRGPERKIDLLVARLDRLVSLTAAQKTEAAAIFTAENDALDAFSSLDERLEKGVPIRQKMRAQIRALLMPGQRGIYDREPQRLGGGAMQDPAAIADRIDQLVELSDEQLARVAEISQKETDALLAIPVEDRSLKGTGIRQEAKSEVRALLTPEQQQKLDANPNRVDDLVARASVISFIKTSPAIATRLGPVRALSLTAATLTTMRMDEQTEIVKGSYTYNVRGGSGTERLKIHWEKGGSSTPVQVTGIENDAGETIRP